ncbi:importin subunit alpha-1b-like [Curcuma longa]|uniref:importin subunit alpha-1b-like n=1 Tax=Curcuma longa TaxID=136217 RepID=UPI003D9E59C0
MTLSDRTLFDLHSKMSLLRAATWTLLSLCCGSPPVALEHTKPALQILHELIFSADDECVIIDACRALDSIADGTSEKIQAVIEADVCPPLVDLLSHPSSQVIEFTLRAIGNIVMGDDLQTQVVIDKGALPCLFKLLSENYGKDIKWEVCWVISNITAGNRAQIQAIINADIIGPLIHILRHAKFDVKKEAAWALSNVTSEGSNLQIHEIYEKAVRMLEKYWVGEEDEAQDAQGAIECAEPSSEFQDDQSNLTSTERL